MIEEIRTQKGVTPSAPISQAIRAGNFIFISGQTGRDPKTREIVSEDVGEQTIQIFKNVSNVLHAAGCTLDDVVRNTVFFTDLKDKSSFDTAYREIFSPPYPARSAIGISEIAPGAKIEIEVIAFNQRV
jgi:2-iminobutanoate/2-iminopropanoate deaminase